MTRIELAPGIVEDFERILDHLASSEAHEPAQRIDEIIAAIDVLAANPEIGRHGPNELRELVIGRGSHGYIALYRYLPELDTVFVLAIRGRREAG